jgi:hypothetical protein
MGRGAVPQVSRIFVLFVSSEVFMLKMEISRLDQAKVELTAIRDAFCKQWMLPDQKTVKRAKEEAAAGKFREL